MAAANHGYRGIFYLAGRGWTAEKKVVLDGGRRSLRNGTNHPTPEEAAHHYDILIYLIYGEEADFNLPERMTPQLKAQLDGYADVHAYLKERKEAAGKALDERFCKGSSKFRGVSWTNSNKPWRMCAQIKGKKIQGSFVEEKEAAHAYDRVILEQYGRSRPTNFPVSSYVEAGEFSELQLDEIDARVAAGKPAPASGIRAAANAKGKAKAQAKPWAPPHRRDTAAAAAEGGPSGCGSEAAVAAAAAAVELEAEDDYYDSGSEFWSSEAEDELLLGSGSRHSFSSGLFGGSSYGYDSSEEQEVPQVEFDALWDRCEALGVFKDLEKMKDEFRQLRIAELHAATERRDRALGTPDEELARLAFEESKDEAERMDELMPSDATLLSRLLRQDIEKQEAALRECIDKYPLGAAIVLDDSQIWRDDGTPNLLAMFKEMEELEGQVPELMATLDAEARDVFVRCLLQMRHVFEERGFDLVAPPSADHLAVLKDVFDFEGKCGSTETEEVDRSDSGARVARSTDEEGDSADESGGEGEQEGGSSGKSGTRRQGKEGERYNGPAPFPSSFAPGDIEKLLQEIAAAASGMPILAGNDGGSGASPTSGSTAASCATDGSGYTSADYARLLQAMQEGEARVDAATAARATAAAAAGAAGTTCGRGGAAASPGPGSPEFEQEGLDLERLLQTKAEEVQKMVGDLSSLEWKHQERTRERNFAMGVTYWEGLVYAHFAAGKTSWLEKTLGPDWQQRLQAAAQPGAPRIFGTHGGPKTWFPKTVGLAQMQAEMTGLVPTCTLSQGLASELGLEGLTQQGGPTHRADPGGAELEQDEELRHAIPELDDVTLQNWFAAVKEQVAADVPITGLLPREDWDVACNRYHWPAVGPRLLSKMLNAAMKPANRSYFLLGEEEQTPAAQGAAAVVAAAGGSGNNGKGSGGDVGGGEGDELQAVQGSAMQAAS